MKYKVRLYLSELNFFKRLFISKEQYLVLDILSMLYASGYRSLNDFTVDPEGISLETFLKVHAKIKLEEIVEAVLREVRSNLIKSNTYNHRLMISLSQVVELIRAEDSPGNVRKRMSIASSLMDVISIFTNIVKERERYKSTVDKLKTRNKNMKKKVNQLEKIKKNEE